MDSFVITHLHRSDIERFFGKEVADSLTDEDMREIAANMHYNYYNSESFINNLQIYVNKLLREQKPKFILRCPSCEGVDIYTVGSLHHLKLDCGQLVIRNTTQPTSEEKVYKCNKCGFSSECIDCFISERE